MQIDPSDQTKEDYEAEERFDEALFRTSAEHAVNMELKRVADEKLARKLANAKKSKQKRRKAEKEAIYGIWGMSERARMKLEEKWKKR